MSWKRDQNFQKYPDLTQEKEGKFLKGCTPKATIIHLRGLAPKGWMASPDNRA
jgi:hypothetical protein